MRDRFTNLVKALSRYCVIPDAQWDALGSRIIRREFATSEYFDKAGNVSKEICFVEKGLFRSFYRNANGDEFIKNFCTEGQVVGSFSSLLTKKPSELSIQALEPSVVHMLDYGVFEEFCQNNHCWETSGRILAQYIFLESDRKEHQLLVYNAAERYEFFLKTHEKIAKRIHQYMIAMYLGISPVSLSRIINSRAKPSKA
ncbi:MAG: Crp/Fnr family transcriptional regulator [Oligoflexus sp.]|nr:Crp/Fnr family transcriptional regulator [Oligoflexus sp.]